MSDNNQNYIDKINQLTSQPDTPTDLQQGVEAMTNGAQAMLTQAQSGELVFDPVTVRSLVDSLNQQIVTLQSMNSRIAVISRQTKLGMTAGGQAMSKFNEEVAVSGPKAFAPSHNQFIQTLKTAVQAIQIAMDNYAETEAANAQSLKPKD